MFLPFAPVTCNLAQFCGFSIYGIMLFLMMQLSAPVSAQTYKVIEPQNEVKPYPLNLPNDLVGMNSAVHTKDGFLWISSTEGLIISDGHESIMYKKDNSRFPLLLDNPEAFLGGLQLDSSGNVYAVISNQPKIIRFDSDTRMITGEWSVKDSTQPASFLYDVTREGAVYALVLEQDTDTFTIWKMNAAGHNEPVFNGTKQVYGSCVNYHLFQSMHWIQTTAGIMRISLNGEQVHFHPTHNKNQSVSYPPYRGEYYFFYDHGQRAFMYWDAQKDSPCEFIMSPELVQLSSGFFMVRDHFLYVANGYYFFILDTMEKSIQDLSAITYEMKKAIYPGAISEDILGFHIIDNQIFLLGSKYLYEVKAKPPPKEKFQVSISLQRPDVSMRGLAEDEHHHVYASYYNGIEIRRHGTKVFNPWPPAATLNTSLYSAYSLTYHKPYIFWHSLRIHTESGQASQVIPNQINGHVVHLLTDDTLFLFTWYHPYLYSYEIETGKVDSIRIQSSGQADDDFPYIINKMVSSFDGHGIWFATRSDGIKLISSQGRIMQSFSVDELKTTKHEGVNDILLVGEYLWYGCSDGLGRLNTKTREIIMFTDPLITPAMQQRPRTIYTIVPDGQKGFYLGSHQGIVYFDTTIFQFVHLSAAHPLSQPEFNRTSAFRDTQGRYYFGSTYGLYSFLPEELEFQSSARTLHPIKLFGIAIFDGKKKQYRYLTSALNELDELKLLPSETNIEFNLAVPSFDQDIYYSYRLQGMHDQWSEYAADPKILFYALPPGTYLLEVKAAANANDSNTATFQLPITMAASWYQKTWVWVLLTIGFSAFVALLVRYWYQQKWKRQKALEALRIKISSDLHDDVGSILSGLAMQSQVMSYETEESKRKPFLELSSMSREAMERMRDTVWAIDARKDKFENLQDRMRDFAEKNFERKNITHTFTFPGIDGKKFINPEIRQNIYLIFKEAVTNIIRHSDADHVNIIFSQEVNRLLLVIHDNGKVKYNGDQSGQGISNMNMRAARMGGELSITDENGFCVELKWSVK